MTQRRSRHFENIDLAMFVCLFAVGCAPLQIGVGSDPNSGAGSTANAGAAGASGRAANAGAAPAPSCAESNIEIRGHVTSPRGEPLQGVQLTLAGATDTTTTTDADGAYLFSQVCSGVAVLTPSYAGLRFCNAQAVYANLTTSVDEDFTGSTNGCVAPEIPLRLGIVIFDPIVKSGGRSVRLSATMGWQDPEDLAAQYRRAIEAVTNGRVRYEVVQTKLVEEYPKKTDGFSYANASYLECLATPDTACHKPDLADYAAISAEQGLCENVNNGVIDEVWLFGAPYFGFPLLQRLGPEALAPAGAGWVLGTSCGRVTNVFGFSYERGLDVMLGGLHNQAEVALEGIYGAWIADQSDTTYHQYEHVEQLSPTLGMSACGGHGYAPNASQTGQYDNLDLVQSNCDAYYDYPRQDSLNALSRTINCTAWGCSGMGYDRYWLRHLPAAKGTGADGKLADWWRYLFCPDDALATNHITCSSSYQTGWCNSVADGAHGTCNSGEWATSHRSTGWVEFSWPEPMLVNKVVLFDRACDERVMRGHLEFSDGAPAQAFDALEDTGQYPTTVVIAARPLRWLRVVIDESIGDNPGFGEIEIR